MSNPIVAAAGADAGVATRVAVAWGYAVVAAFAVCVFAPHDVVFVWHTLALAVGVVLSFCLALTVPSSSGFLARVSAMASGVLVIVAIAAAVSGFMIALGG